MNNRGETSGYRPAPQKRSYMKALRLYLRYADKPAMFKFFMTLRLVALGYAPVAVLNDVVPFVGMIDDPMILVAAAAAFYIHRNVRKYQSPDHHPGR